MPKVPEFSDWATTTRPGLDRSPSASRPAHPPPVSRTRTLAIAAGGLALLLAVYATRASPPQGFNPGDPILLADLENTTGDSLFDRSLTTAAAIGLQQSPQLRLLSRTEVIGVPPWMGRTGPDTVPPSPESARALAIRGSPRFVVTFRIDRDGDGYRLGGEIRRVESTRIITSAEARAATRAGTLTALDRILQAIRAGFGERRSERVTRTVSLPEAATPSLEALGAYASGGRAWHQADYPLARDLWERALALDTGFVQAMAGLGAFHYDHGRRGEGQRYYDEAVRRVYRLTEWDRYRILADYAGYRGDLDSAVRIAKMVADRFPSSVSWYRYGTALGHAGRNAEAIGAVTRALRFDSTFSQAYLALATASTGAAALRYYRRAERFDSTSLLQPPVSTEFGNRLILLGQFADADRHFQRVLGQPGPFDQVLAHQGLGFLAVWQGRLEQGLAHFRAAAEVGRRTQDSMTIARSYLLEAQARLLAGDTAGARETMQQIKAIADRTRFEPEFLLIVGTGFLRTGRVDLADSLLARIDRPGDLVSQVDRSARDLLAAAIAATRGDGERALQLLGRIGQFPQRHLLNTWRAAAEMASGNGAGARKALEAVVAEPTVTSEATFEWLWSLTTLGDLLARQGDRPAAAAAYRRLLNQWAQGDRTSLVRSLEGRLNALRAE